MDINIKDIPIYYKIHGEGFPIIMLHGYSPDHRIMSGCMEPIFKNRPGYQRIYFDLPGMGQTPTPDWLNCSDQMLEIVQAFIEAIIPGQHYLLVGESYGGYLARAFIKEQADLIEGVMFICPLIDPLHRSELPPMTILEKDTAFTATLPAEMQTELDNIAVIQTPETYARLAAEVHVGLRSADQPFLDRFYAQGYPLSMDLDDLAAPFTKPTLFITGRQDNIVGYQSAWDIIAQYPRATFVVLDIAGHNAQIEQPELFDVLTHNWLDRVEKELSTN
ncbi:MAG: alpha/beta hydrolase [Anaerolineales bacterium]|nr:alpha/beta hydrolase [Anaerolineales bacterium]